MSELKRKGGAGPYRRGATHERLVKKAYEAQGYFVIRSPQSGSAIDLLAVSPKGKIEWVQCKLKGYARPMEREAVISLAQTFGGTAILAWGNGPIMRMDLEKEKALEAWENPGRANRPDPA
jgi:Holliday junction resolvase